MRRSRLVPTLVLVGMFVVWEIAVHVLRVPPYLLPPPSMLLLRIVADWRLITDNSWVTLQEVLVGFGLAAAVSIPLAALLQRFRTLEEALYPLLVSSQTIPKVAIAPLLVVWFGFGSFPKVLIAFLVCFFPILVDTLTGLHALPREVRWLARSMGASGWDTLVKIRIPAALPNIFSGLKVASTLAVVGAVVGEFVGSDRGLGHLLIVANGTMNVQLAFAVLIVLSVMGVALFAAVEALERALLPWHVSQRMARQ
jgi:NitT/TauT family transport system permease protein